MSNDLVPSENTGPAATEPVGTSGGIASPGAVASALPGDLAARKAEIEAIMNSDFDRYEREGLNREYLEILEAEMMGADPDAGVPTRPMDAGESRTILCGSQAGQKLVWEWERAGGFNVHLRNVQKTVGELVRDIGPNRAQRAFMERFDRSTSEAARAAIYDEIASGASFYVAPATDAQVKAFADTPAGRILVPEWGTEATTRLATLHAREKRLRDNMDEDDWLDVLDWLDGLDAETAAKILRKVSA